MIDKVVIVLHCEKFSHKCKYTCDTHDPTLTQLKAEIFKQEKQTRWVYTFQND